MQHTLLGSMTKRTTNKPEILIPIPRPGQEPSIYICLSPAKTADFMHPKWERCITINSLIFVVVCRNILYCLNLGKNYLWTKPTLNKNDRLYKKAPYGYINCSNRVRQTQLVLELIEKEYNKHFDYIVISVQHSEKVIQPYYAKEWIKNDNKVWLVNPKYNLYQWIKKFSKLLLFFVALFIIKYIIANEGLDKRRQPLLELSISGRDRGDYLWLLTQSYTTKKFKKTGQGHIFVVSKRKGRC